MAPIMNASRKRSASASDPDEEIVRPSKVQRLDPPHQDAAAIAVEASDDSQNISDGSGFIVDTSYGGTNRGERAQHIGNWMNEVPADAGDEDDRELVEVELLDVRPVEVGEDLAGPEAVVNGNGYVLAPVDREIEQPVNVEDYLLRPGVDYDYYGEPFYGGYAQEGYGVEYPFLHGYEDLFNFKDYVDDDEGEQAEMIGALHEDLVAGEEVMQAEMEAAQEVLSVSDYGEPGFYVAGNYVADHPVIRAIVQGPAYPAAQHQPAVYQGAWEGWQAAGYDGQQGYGNGAANGARENSGEDHAENDGPDGYGSHDHPIDVDDDSSASEEDEEDDDDEPDDYGSEEHPIDVDDDSSSSEDDDDDDDDGEEAPSSSSHAVLAPGQAYVYIPATEQQHARMFFNPEDEPVPLAPGQAYVQVGRFEQSHARLLSALGSDEEEAEGNEPVPLAPGQAYVQVGRVEQQHARMLSALGSDEEDEDENEDEANDEDEGNVDVEDEDEN